MFLPACLPVAFPRLPSPLHTGDFGPTGWIRVSARRGACIDAQRQDVCLSRHTYLRESPRCPALSKLRHNRKVFPEPVMLCYLSLVGNLQHRILAFFCEYLW